MVQLWLDWLNSIQDTGVCMLAILPLYKGMDAYVHDNSIHRGTSWISGMTSLLEHQAFAYFAPLSGQCGQNRLVVYWQTTMCCRNCGMQLYLQ